MRPKKKCLVLGGAGFLGRNLVEHLLGARYSVRVYDRLRVYPALRGGLETEVEYVKGDFCNTTDFDYLLKNIDVVYHLISNSLPANSNNNPMEDAATNLLPTLGFLEAAKVAQVSKVIFFSSGGTVYGDSKEPRLSESYPIRPLCAYGVHKAAIELYLALYYQLYNLDYCVMRISNPYGSYQKDNKLQGVIPIFLQKIMCGEDIDIWGDGSIVRDYIHVDDVMRAAIGLIDYSGEEKVFNVGAGVGLSLSDLVTLMQEIVGKESTINYLPGRTADVQSNVLDISRIQTQIPWSPTISLEEGMRRLLCSLSD